MPVRFHVNGEELFSYDPNSPQISKEKGTEQVAIVTKIRVEDRTDNQAQFEFAFIKGEDGHGIIH